MTYISLEKKEKRYKILSVILFVKSNIGLFLKPIYIKFEEVVIKKFNRTSIVASTS